MNLSFDYWFLFPISIAVATMAMASGVGGAVFFSPIFLLWLKLEAPVAIGAALITELFGFSSGLVAYARARLIDFKLGAGLLMFSIPGAIIGVTFSDAFPAVVLKTVFAVGLVFIGLQLYTSWRQEQKEALDAEIERDGSAAYTSRLTDRSGKTYFYTVCSKALGRTLAAVGGMFLGMISVGLAELQEYHLVAKCKVPSPVAVATSIFVVVCTVLVASVGHAIQFASSTGDALAVVLNVTIFTVPGVILGGQIGPRVGAKMDPDRLKVSIAFVFMGIGAFMLFSMA